MSLISEFKEFINKGNVIDLAVGVVIGAAFNKIVGAFVDGILMPPIGQILGGKNFADMKYQLSPAITDASGKITTPENAIMYGNAILAIIQFLITAFFIFLFVKAYNNMKKEAAAAPPAPSSTDILLGEIRDALKK